MSLSSDLQALLKRIQPQKQVYNEASPEPTPALLSLLGRMEARRWKEETLVQTVEYIRESANEIKLILHLRTCEQCQMEACLSVERYGGRGLPWFLDLINDVNEGCLPYYADDEDPRFDDCPRVENYRIGSYWEDAENERKGVNPKPKETLKFIEDRCSWAEKIIRQQIVMATQFYKRLKNWDLNGQPPEGRFLPF